MTSYVYIVIRHEDNYPIGTYECIEEARECKIKNPNTKILKVSLIEFTNLQNLDDMNRKYVYVIINENNYPICAFEGLYDARAYKRDHDQVRILRSLYIKVVDKLQELIDRFKNNDVCSSKKTRV